MITSAQAADEVFGAQMRVSLEHLELFVSANGRHLGDIQALLKKATNSFVAQIVEVKVIHPSTDAKVLEGAADRVTCDRKHPLGVSALCHRHLPITPVRSTMPRCSYAFPPTGGEDDFFFTYAAIDLINHGAIAKPYSCRVFMESFLGYTT
jgi:hypothetical protein